MKHTSLLSVVLLAGLAGCGVRSEEVKPASVTQVKQFTDQNLEDLRVAIDKNDHAPQAAITLSYHIGSLRARWINDSPKQAIDPELDARIQQVAAELYRNSRGILAGMAARKGPPTLSAEQLDMYRQLLGKAQNVIDEMDRQMKADGTVKEGG